jgi:hypothetical protein
VPAISRTQHVASVNSDAQTWIRAYQISRTQNFRSGGCRRLRPRSRSGPCPLRPHPYWWERGRTSSTQRTSPAQCEHAMIPAENPPNVRQRGRYNRQFVRPNERSVLDYSRGARPRMAGCGCSAAARRSALQHCVIRNWGSRPGRGRRRSSPAPIRSRRNALCGSPPHRTRVCNPGTSAAFVWPLFSLTCSSFVCSAVHSVRLERV